MRRKAWVAIVLVVGSIAGSTAFGGDREAVTEQLQSIAPTWSDALFSIDVHGTEDGNASLNQRLDIAYEAASPGYFAYLRVSSHGDVTLYRDPARSGRRSGAQPYIIKPPLGSEQLIVLFANAPWDTLFAKGASTRDVGSEPDAVSELLAQLTHLNESNVLFAARRYDLTIAATPGGTQYTTRAIIRTVTEAGDRSGGGAGGGAGAARIPSRIEFEFDSDRLTAQGKLDLDTFGEALVTELRDRTVSLEGHTDAIGTDEYNQSLSERRAVAARQYLIDSFGIANSRIATIGMGKSDPVASNDDAAGRSKNRRVDFVFSQPAAQASH